MLTLYGSTYIRGNVLFVSKLAATFFQIVRNVLTLPVKLTAAKSGELITLLLKSIGFDGRKLMTPGAKFASSNTLYTTQLDNIDVSLGFHTTALPINAGAEHRFPEIAVKLNGEMAATKPSNPRRRNRFLISSDGLIG